MIAQCNTGAIATSLYEYGLPILLLGLCSVGLTFMMIRIYKLHLNLKSTIKETKE